MKIALLTTDNRENFREYDKTEPYFGTAAGALLQGMAELPQVEVHVVSCTQERMLSPAKLAANVWYHSLVVPKIGWLRTGYQGCIRAVRKKLRETQPDIVHAHGTERDCGLSGIFSGFANVLTIHGNMRLIAKVNRAKPFSYQWLAARLEKLTLPRAGGVVCLSKYTQDAVQDLARRTWVVPNAVDSTFFGVRPAASEAPLILCVGHVCQRKNQQQFVRAIDPIAASRGLQVLFLGDAPRHDPYCAEFFQMLQVRPWCTYGGLAERTQLRDYLSRTTLLALPSVEDNCPMAVLEAMAASVPVVAAKVGGLPDLIEHEVNGLFCDPGDLSSIRTAVDRLILDSKFRQELAARAKRIALDRYHPKTVAERHLAVYREVLRTDS